MLKVPTLYVPLTTVTSSSFLTGTAPTCTCVHEFNHFLCLPRQPFATIRDHCGCWQSDVKLLPGLLTVYFVLSSLERGALISFLLTFEGAEKCACKSETKRSCITARDVLLNHLQRSSCNHVLAPHSTTSIND